MYRQIQNQITRRVCATAPLQFVQTLIGIPLFYVPSYDSTHKKPYTQLPGSRSFYSFRELKHTKPLPSGQREKQTAPKTRYIKVSTRTRTKGVTLSAFILPTSWGMLVFSVAYRETPAYVDEEIKSPLRNL